MLRLLTPYLLALLAVACLASCGMAHDRHLEDGTSAPRPQVTFPAEFSTALPLDPETGLTVDTLGDPDGYAQPSCAVLHPSHVFCT